MRNGRLKQNPHLSAKHGNIRDRAAGYRVLTFYVGAILLMLALVGGGFMIYIVFTSGWADIFNQDILLRALTLVLTFMLGWFMSVISVRRYYNLALPVVIRFYSWVVLGVSCFLYIRTILKLWEQLYTVEKFILYLVLLLASVAALVLLGLIVEGARLTVYALPLLLIAILHLVAIVFHYTIFAETVKPDFFFADLFTFIIMLSIGAILLNDAPILNPIRRWLSAKYPQRADQTWDRR